MNNTDKFSNSLLYAIIIYPILLALAMGYYRNKTGVTYPLEPWQIYTATAVGAVLAIIAVVYGIIARRRANPSAVKSYNIIIIVGVVSLIMWRLLANNLLYSLGGS